jgi:uncharacterized protein YdhG (YjbR/CyaY superfamily)
MTVITDYIEHQPAATQEKLTRMYTLIKVLLPDASERISYGMPTFWQGHNIVHFAAFKNHIGFYPAPSGVEHFAAALTAGGYKWSKGAIQFPYAVDLPERLITEIVEFRRAENSGK